MSDVASDVRLVAIINSLNRRALLAASLESLSVALKQLPFSTAVVVFEAGSTDGSREWLQRFQIGSPSPEVSIVVAAPDEDSSFAAGVNNGCREAILRYPSLEYLLLFETDNLVDEGEPIALAVRLLDSHSRLGAVGFTVTKRSGEPAGFGCSFPSALQFLLGQQLTAMLRLDQPKLSAEPTFEGYTWGICDVAYTSPLLVRRAAWVQTQGMDATVFPFSDSDLDWCWRASQTGWRIAVLQLKGVIHDNEQQASSWSAKRVINFHRSRLRLLRKHLGYSGHLLKLGLLIRHVLEFVALIVGSPLLSDPRGSLRKRWLLIISVMRGYRV